MWISWITQRNLVIQYNCNFEFTYFKNNIYIIIKDLNHNDYFELVELINNKIILTNENDGLYVLIIYHPIVNFSEFRIKRSNK